MNKFKNYAALWAILLASLFVPACTDTGKPPTTQPVTQEVPDSLKICKTIAGLPDTSAKNSRAVGAKGKFWDPGTVLTVKFLNGTAQQQQWLKDAAAYWFGVPINISFSYVATGNANVRVSFNANDGAWSYVGKDNLSVPQGYATMNIGWHEGGTGDASLYTVELHELGHLWGLLHEHQNPDSPIDWDKPVVYAALSGPPNNWTTAQIDFNVLNPFMPVDVISTVRDPNSIMHYSIAAAWRKSKVAIPGGKTLSPVDRSFIKDRYPFPVIPPNPGGGNVTLTPAQQTALLNNAVASATAAATGLTKAQATSTAAAAGVTAAQAAKAAADANVAALKSAFGIN